LNFFFFFEKQFRDERDRLLYGGEMDYTKEKAQALLNAHWNRDRTAKRKHRKTHGKVRMQPRRERWRVFCMFRVYTRRLFSNATR
jgi:hypothetical protein